MSKMSSNGSKKVSLGSGDAHIGQNCAPNAMECLPDPKTSIKNSKKAKKVKNPENPGFPVFSYRSLLVPIEPGVGSAAWGAARSYFLFLRGCQFKDTHKSQESL